MLINFIFLFTLHSKFVEEEIVELIKEKNIYVIIYQHEQYDLQANFIECCILLLLHNS